MGAGLWEGIAGAGLRAEFRLAGSGVVLFLIGWALERRLARRK